MIAGIVAGKADLDAEPDPQIGWQFDTIVRRLVHGYGSERALIVAMHFERERQRETRARETDRIVSSLGD